MELARAIEDFTVWLASHPKEQAADQDLSKLYFRGWNRALGLFIDSSCEERGVPLTPSTKAAEEWAGSILRHCGRISQCEFVLSLWETGLIYLLETRGDTIRFRMASRRSGIEQVERDDMFWLQDRIVKSQKADMAKLSVKFDAVARSMRELVRPWRDHYIAYDTTPEIDSFFDEWGALHARTLLGHDSFPGHTLLGGLEFDTYRGAVEVMISIALKHRYFCFALLKEHAEIRPRNIYATPRSIEDLARVLEFLLEIDRGDAALALETLTLTADNREYHCSKSSAGYHPPLIAVGSKDVMLSSLGCLDTPFSFVLGELRRRFPGDWDRATNIREGIFRKELYNLFTVPSILKLDRNVRLREKGKTITDIDALMLDRRSGTLGLFQLKWQDPFGDSMRKRQSRRKNFLKNANGWVEAVDRWIEERDLRKIGKALGVNDPAASNIRRIRIFVIGRSFSGFSGEDLPDERAAWGLWPQVLRLMYASSGAEDPIGGLFEALIKDAPALRLPTMTGAEWLRLEFRDKTIVVEPPS
jgi:hypothetical protein